MMGNRWVRQFMGLLAGSIIGFAVVMLVEGAGHLMFPPPPGTDLSNPAAMATIMNQVPLGAKVAVVVAWFLGTISGALIAVRIIRDWRPAWIIAGVFILVTAMTIAAIPHPMWMVAAGLLLPLAAAWIVSARFRQRL